MTSPSLEVFANPERYYEDIPKSHQLRDMQLTTSVLGDGKVRVTLSLAGLVLTEICTFEPDKPLEGHAHLYVDGIKRATMYSPEATITDLSPGHHTITVTFNRPPTHRVLSIEGRPLSATAIVEVL